MLVTFADPLYNAAMFRTGTSASTLQNSEKAAEQAAHEALSKTGVSQCDLVLLFCSIHHCKNSQKIVKKIREITGARHIVGASGYGVITETGEREGSPSLAVMTVADGDTEMLPFLIHDLQENNLKAGEQLGQKIIASGISPSCMLLFPDSFSFQSYFFFEGFENAYGYVPMIGGSASENGRHSISYQIMDDRIAFDAVSGVVLGGDLRIETGITQSCQPFGEPVQITRADGNVIYEMDGRPAYEILLESLAKIDLMNSDEIFQQVFLGLPLRSFQTNFSKSSYLIRNIMGVNAKKGMLALAAPVEQGDFVTFTVRDPDLAKNDLTVMLEDLKHRFAPAKPFCGFYFNCCARGQSLYSKSNVDIEMIREFFPETPIIGFSTYGEIAPVDHVNHLHHYSGILTLLGR